MKRFWAQSLRRQLFIAMALLLVPVLAAAIWSGIATVREQIDELRTQSRIVARTAAAWVTRDITAFEPVASALTQVDAVRRFDPQVSGVLRHAAQNRTAVRDIVLARADGTLIGRSSPSLNLDLGTAWVDRAVRTSQRIVEPIKAAASGEPYLVLAYPVRDGSQQVAGALGYVVDLRALQEGYRALPLPADSLVTVSDEEGRILAHSADPRQVGELVPSTERAAIATLASGEHDDPDGIRRMQGRARADAGPWVVTIGIPTSLAWANAVGLWSRSFAILVFGLIGSVIVAAILSRRFTETVSHLDATAQRIAAGDFSPIEQRPMLSREFADLQAAFDAMLRRFNATREALDARAADERRIRQELESLQGQVIRQERLAAVGQLVSGVAHEINNPLQAILGFAELLQMQPDVPDSVKSDLRLIQKESARACAIIRNLALFARQQPGEAAPVRLSDVITSVIELRQRRLESEHIDLQIQDTSIESVMAVPTELQQVILNFVINAEQAILTSGRQTGSITIRTTDRHGRVLLEVEDTGPGIDPEHEARLFEPFFTTKPVGQGTGLGLSVSYGIIDSMGGRIGYRRATTGGSIFFFELPVVSEVEA